MTLVSNYCALSCVPNTLGANPQLSRFMESFYLLINNFSFRLPCGNWVFGKEEH